MRSDELELWNRIKAFQFDKPGISLTFARRLSKENGFSEAFAEQIIDEYRKFVFLCCVSKGQMSPSPNVDLAWHLHLTYTRSYWTDLCENTINRDLHHEPTEGGIVEENKFKDLYQNTLETYRTYFSSEPPTTIWPGDLANSHAPVERIANSGFFEFLSDRRRFSMTIFMMTIAGLFVGCSAITDSLTGTVMFVVAIGIGLFLLIRSRKNSNRDGGSGCGSGGCGGTPSIFGGDDGGSSDGGNSDGAGDSGCSSGCSGGGCGGGGD